MTQQDFIPNNYSNEIQSGEITSQAPSNIALIKYWGKRENQIPANPSLSFTLKNCLTTTSIQYQRRENQEKTTFEVYLDNNRNDNFRPKIERFVEMTAPYLPFLKDYFLDIRTSNSFPHSSGIASSASGMSALALCLVYMEKELLQNASEDYLRRKASFLSRLGSGSACRSTYGGVVVWGKNEFIPGSSDLFGIPHPFEIHENFKDYQDVILLIDKGEKEVSSTIGHNLMTGHPFANQRFRQAHENLSQMTETLKSGNLNNFIDLVEGEALTLHAMMMSSQPNFLLMKPGTLSVIQKIRELRKSTKLHPCFTLDAGANVHLLFPRKEKEEILDFVREELKEFCQDGEFICDEVGQGARLVENNHN